MGFSDQFSQIGHIVCITPTSKLIKNAHRCPRVRKRSSPDLYGACSCQQQLDCIGRRRYTADDGGPPTRCPGCGADLTSFGAGGVSGRAGTGRLASALDEDGVLADDPGGTHAGTNCRVCDEGLDIYEE